MNHHLEKFQYELKELVEFQFEDSVIWTDISKRDNFHKECSSLLDKLLIDILREKTHSHQSRMAQMLGINRGTLRTKMKECGYLK